MTRFAGTQASSAHVASLVALYSPISHFALTFRLCQVLKPYGYYWGSRRPLCGQSPQRLPLIKRKNRRRRARPHDPLCGYPGLFCSRRFARCPFTSPISHFALTLPPLSGPQTLWLLLGLASPPLGQSPQRLPLIKRKNRRRRARPHDPLCGYPGLFCSRRFARCPLFSHLPFCPYSSAFVRSSNLISIPSTPIISPASSLMGPETVIQRAPVMRDV